MRWKWQNRQKFNKDKRRPIPGRRCSARSGHSTYSDVTHNTLLAAKGIARNEWRFLMSLLMWLLLTIHFIFKTSLFCKPHNCKYDFAFFIFRLNNAYVILIIDRYRFVVSSNCTSIADHLIV